MNIWFIYRVLTPALLWTATYGFMVGVCVDVLPLLTSAQLLPPLPRLEILLKNFHARFVGSKWMPTNVYVSLKDRHKVNLSLVFMPGVPLGLHPNLTRNQGWQFITISKQRFSHKESYRMIDIWNSRYILTLVFMKFSKESMWHFCFSCKVSISSWWLYIDKTHMDSETFTCTNKYFVTDEIYCFWI